MCVGLDFHQFLISLHLSHCWYAPIGFSFGFVVLDFQPGIAK